jgi:hypothetical protein
MSLERRIEIIRISLCTLAVRLKESGYRFLDSAAVLPGPELNTAGSIAKLEAEIGPLPLALKLFWQRVGSVDFRGDHFAWDGCDYPDPLFVYPPSAAVEELNDFLADKEERLRHDFPYLIPISPDFYHKAGYSGGMWYHIRVPSDANDPPIVASYAGSEAITFLGYLEFAIRCAGFPGLAQCPGHNWPIDKLIEGLGAEE